MTKYAAPDGAGNSLGVFFYKDVAPTVLGCAHSFAVNQNSFGQRMELKNTPPLQRISKLSDNLLTGLTFFGDKMFTLNV
jgi:hypothetical protein